MPEQCYRHISLHCMVIQHNIFSHLCLTRESITVRVPSFMWYVSLVSRCISHVKFLSMLSAWFFHYFMTLKRWVLQVRSEVTKLLLPSAPRSSHVLCPPGLYQYTNSYNLRKQCVIYFYNNIVAHSIHLRTLRRRIPREFIFFSAPCYQTSNLRPEELSGSYNWKGYGS
jgi:hypothetical protein